MSKWNKDSFAVGTRVKLTDRFNSFNGTVVDPREGSFDVDELWIKPDSNANVPSWLKGANRPFFGWSDFDIEVIPPVEPVQQYTVRFVHNGEPVKIFTVLDLARNYRDGWNDAARGSIDVHNVNVTKTVTEMQPVETEKVID